jgi:uncharacterized protein YbjQ (UPF0145 family)
MRCSNCGAEIPDDVNFCSRCGSEVFRNLDDFLTVTTPNLPGYKVTKILGVVTGIAPRTANIFGKLVAGFESMLGGEITAFMRELEKARFEAIRRAQRKAVDLGANAIIGLDLETSDLGLQLGILVISATGTAVVVERDTS